MKKIVWTQEKYDELRQLLGEGKSRTEVATIMNANRNAIAGAVWRLKRQRQTVAPPTLLTDPPPEPEGPPFGVPFINISYGQCRSILGNHDGLALYCGKPTATNTSWCEDHLRVYFIRRRGEHA